MMLTHGIPKIGRIFGDRLICFTDPFGLGPEVSLSMAIFAEVICSGLIFLGIKTRWATILLLITMLVAALYAYWSDPFVKKELPLLFLATFLSVLLSGGGKFSEDGMRK